MSHSPKYVFAHFMVGNTYPYTIDDWRQDILLASSHHIDGFALNVGQEGWQRDRVADCFQACLNVQPGLDQPFWLFLSLDMSSIPSSTPEDLELICDYLRAFGDHPHMHRHDGKVFLSTFSGQESTFGQNTMEKGWSWAKRNLEQIVPIHFIPSFFIDPARYPTFTALDGAYNWNGSWPIHLSHQSAREEILSAVKHLKTDDHHIHHLRRERGQTFMAAVSPWFFTHYGVDSWNKNWLYRCDDHLFAERWKELISNRHNVDVIQVISWNDYGESHYIAPVRGAQPNSQAWVDGFPHVAFLKLNAYFARAYKEGRYPPIQEDALYVWARPHPKNAQCTHKEEEVKIGRPRGWELVEDRCWVVATSSQPHTVLSFSSPSKNQSLADTSKVEVRIPAGITMYSFPLLPDTGIDVALSRNGKCLVRVAPSVEEFCFLSRPRVYNFNVWTGYDATSSL